jgi:hypothetical protein
MKLECQSMSVALYYFINDTNCCHSHLYDSETMSEERRLIPCGEDGHEPCEKCLSPSDELQGAIARDADQSSAGNTSFISQHMVLNSDDNKVTDCTECEL